MICEQEGFVLATVLSAVIIGFNLIYFRNKFDALFLFVNIHICSLIFFLLYQSALLHFANIEFLCIVMSYVLGFAFGYWLHSIMSRITTPSNLGQRRNRELNFRRLFNLNFLGFVCFLLAFYYELSEAKFVLPIFAKDKLTAYLSFPKRFSHYLVVSGIPISGVFIFVAERYRYVRKRCYFLILIISMVLASQLARAVLMAQLFTVAYIYFSERRVRLTWIKLFAAAGGLVAIIYVLGTIRTGESILEIGQMKNWPAWSEPFAWIYLYFATSMENFRDAVTRIHDLDWGANSFLLPFYTLFQMKDALHSSFSGVPSAGGFNTYGFYLAVFLDFGYLGIAYMIGIGFISRLILISKSNVGYLFAPYWTYALFTSSINNYFNAFFTFVYLLYFIIMVSCSRRSSLGIVPVVR